MKRELGILAIGLSLFLAFSSSLEALNTRSEGAHHMCPTLDLVVKAINENANHFKFTNSILNGSITILNEQWTYSSIANGKATFIDIVNTSTKQSSTPCTIRKPELGATPPCAYSFVASPTCTNNSMDALAAFNIFDPKKGK